MRLFLEDLADDLDSIAVPYGQSQLTISSKRRDGLSLRVDSSGQRSWRFRYTRSDGSRNEIVCGGHYDSLEDARAEVDQLRELIKRGIDPVQKRRQDHTEKLESQMQRGSVHDPKVRFSSLVAAWLTHIEARLAPGSVNEYRSALNKYLLPEFAGRNVSTISLVEVEALINSIPTPSVKRKALATIRAFFSYLVDSDVLTHNMLLGKKTLAKTTEVKPRDRVLSGAEIHRFLNELGDQSVSEELKQTLRIQFASGLRISEVAGLRWSQIDMEERFVIKHQVKGGREVETAISDYMLELLVDWRLQCEGGDRLFSDACNVKHATRIIKNKLSPWLAFKSHDLRRTVSTTLMQLGCPEEVRRRILNHKSGSQISRHYDHDQQTALQLDWLNKWGETIEAFKQDPNHLSGDRELSEKRAAQLARLRGLNR